MSMNVLVGSSTRFRFLRVYHHHHPISINPPITHTRRRRRRKPFHVVCCQNRKVWPSLSVCLFGCGFLVGPLIDGIHSRVNLVVYENGAIDIGPLHTNIWVPPLLGLFYTTVGLLQLFLDNNTTPPPPPSQNGFQKVIASLLALVVLIDLSAELYKAGVEDSMEAYILFVGAELMWLAFDRTRMGFALACLVGIACPLAEIPIIKLFHLWYYPQPNIHILGQGCVTWTLTCYFAYTPFLIALSRWLNTLLINNNNISTPET